MNSWLTIPSLVLWSSYNIMIKSKLSNIASKFTQPGTHRFCPIFPSLPCILQPHLGTWQEHATHPWCHCDFTHSFCLQCPEDFCYSSKAELTSHFLKSFLRKSLSSWAELVASYFLLPSAQVLLLMEHLPHVFIFSSHRAHLPLPSPELSTSGTWIISNSFLNSLHPQSIWNLIGMQ